MKNQIISLALAIAAISPVCARQNSQTNEVRVAPQLPANHQPVAPQAVTRATVDIPACEKPAYPKEAARNEWQGTTVMRFVVDTEGKVIDAKIERSSGYPVLDEEALSALSACKHFKPGRVNGKPVVSHARVAYEWKLN